MVFMEVLSPPGVSSRMIRIDDPLSSAALSALARKVDDPEPITPSMAIIMASWLTGLSSAAFEWVEKKREMKSRTSSGTFLRKVIILILLPINCEKTVTVFTRVTVDRTTRQEGSNIVMVLIF
jgi:hypothetical protein